MFGTIRRHQTWLWVVIITMTIISFVIFFSPYSKLNNDRGRAGAFGSINREPIGEEQFADAQREVYLRHFLMTGRWPDEAGRQQQFDPARETYQWLLILQKLKQMDIHVSPSTAAEAARDLVAPFARMGITSPAMLVDRVLKQKGFSMRDFERYVRHHVGLQELITVVGTSGKLVTPEEAKALYVRENQELSTAAVFISLSNYVGNVTVTPETLQQFYSNRAAAYRIPDRVQVSYVTFDITNFLASAEATLSRSNLNDLVEANANRLGTNFYRDAKSAEESKAKIREDLIRNQALAEARRKAAEFASPLVDADNPNPDDLEAAAKQQSLPVAVTPPFEAEEGPTQLDAAAEIAKYAFSRTTNEPFAGPIVGEKAVYVIALKRHVPSELPPLDQIKDRVTADFRQIQARNMAHNAGKAFEMTLTNLLASGKSFEEACKQAGMNPVKLPPFSLSTRSITNLPPSVNLNQLKQAGFSTPVGKVSGFQDTSEGGFILFVEAKLPVDENRMKTELPNFVTYVRQSRQSDAFNEWFRKEAERGLRDIPLNRTQPPPDLNAGKAAKS